MVHLRVAAHRAPSARLASAAALLALGLSSCVGAATKPRPNILLISIDSLRADHVHAYGYEKETTPNLDHLAREGARFDTVIAESSWTIPSHATLLTGVGSRVHGLETGYDRLAPQRRTLAQMLKENGYRTAGIYSGPYLHPVFGFDQGFDSYVSAIPPAEMAATQPGANIVDRLMESQGSSKVATSQEVTDKALRFLETTSDKPFFLFLHYFDVHYDYNPPESFWRHFDPDYKGDFTGANFLSNKAIRSNMNPRDLAHLIALYDGEILYTDHHIGRLLEALDRSGIGTNTLVMVTSDHGDEFFEHDNRGHRHTLYEEVLRVPLIVRLPGRIPAGTRIGGLARHLEIAPTLLSYAGANAPLAGVDLRSSLETGRSPQVQYAVSRLIRNPVKNEWFSVRTPELKYIVQRDGEGRTELLFDLRIDPGETDAVAVVKRRGGDVDPVLGLDRARTQLADSNQRGSPDPVQSLRGAGQLSPDLLEQLRSLGYVH